MYKDLTLDIALALIIAAVLVVLALEYFDVLTK